MTIDFRDLNASVIAASLFLSKMLRSGPLRARIGFEQLYVSYIYRLANFGIGFTPVEVDIQTFLELCLIHFESWARRKKFKAGVELSWLNDEGEEQSDFLYFPLDKEAFDLILDDGASTITFYGIELILD